MKGKNMKRAVIVVLTLVIVVAYIAVKIMFKNQVLVNKEIIQTGNSTKGEMPADATVNWNAEQKENYMKKLSEGWELGTENAKVTAKEVYIDSNYKETMIVPIPIGYESLGIKGEDTVDGGFVIYEKIDEETDNPQEDRNQWVWVPVYEPSEIYGIDSGGKMWGKLYDYDSTGRSNCNWTETDGIMKILSETGFREPDVLENISGTTLITDYDMDKSFLENISEETRKILYKELEDNFKSLIYSIEKYGGFYIGRYETGGLSGEIKVVKNDTDIANQTWYRMYEKCKLLNGKNSNVKTSMIYGCEWDRTLKWLVETGAKNYSEINSTNWGNYTDNLIPSGSSEDTKANNIYDLEGNVNDSTLEVYSNRMNRSKRGGGIWSWRYAAGKRVSHDDNPRMGQRRNWMQSDALYRFIK